LEPVCGDCHRRIHSREHLPDLGAHRLSSGIE
jgi:hypothetical protein